MEPEKINQVKENLTEIKTYIEGLGMFPANAALQWIHKSLGITLGILEEPEPKPEPDPEADSGVGFDHPPEGQTEPEPDPESEPIEDSENEESE